MPDSPDRLTFAPGEVPPEGALGLLALGYRGLEAWRAARGTGWVEERRKEWEAYQALLAEEAAAERAAAYGADADAPPA